MGCSCLALGYVHFWAVEKESKQQTMTGTGITSAQIDMNGTILHAGIQTPAAKWWRSTLLATIALLVQSPTTTVGSCNYGSYTIRKSSTEGLFKDQRRHPSLSDDACTLYWRVAA